MDVHIASRRCKLQTVERRFPDARIIDVTSRAPAPWVRFSPFYPHGGIPVPNSPNHTAQSVEGVWQGLKVFETEDTDVSKFAITTMKGIKRSVRTRGRVLGHRNGVTSEMLLAYRDARSQIYLPTYRFILENYLGSELDELHSILGTQSLVLLDYETNSDIDNLAKPLSHASLVAQYLRGEWPG